MNKLEKLYELYSEQCSYQVAGNEWSKPLAFHVWLGQALRKPDPQNPKLTIPMTYLRSGREISIREHAFICQGARCLKYNTLVLTEDGPDPIEHLDPDTQKVMSYDFKTRRKYFNKFNKIDTGKQQVYRVDFHNSALAGDDCVIATENHIFFVKEAGQVKERKLKDLKVGDKLAKYSGLFSNKSPAIIKKIYEFGVVQTYDLEVENIHNFVLGNGVVVHNSGKGELMHNAIDMIRRVAKEANWDEVRAQYMDSEPTAQFLKGGNEKSGGRDGSKWVPAPAILDQYSLLALSEGETLVSPKSPYGNFKHVILSATDDRGELSLTARKDLIDEKGGAKEIPSFKTNCSIFTGSVYKDNFATEILQSGLIQRFLFSYQTPSFSRRIGDLKELNRGLTRKVGGESRDAQEECLDYFMKNIHGRYPQKPVKWLDSGARRIDEILDEKFHEPHYGGQKLDTFISFISAIHKHMEKISVHACIATCSEQVGSNHVEYAWEICEPVFQDYIKLIETRFFPDVTQHEKKRIGMIRKIIKKRGPILQKDLTTELKNAKKRMEWDLCESATFNFLKELEAREIFTIIGATEGRGKMWCTE